MSPEFGANNPRDPLNSLAPLPGPMPTPSAHAPVPPHGVVSRPHHGQLPSALTRAPDPFLMLKALQRRWLLASSLGLLLAAAAGSGAFFFMPPPKHTARTLLHVPPPRGVVFKQSNGYGELPNHQRTQVAMLRSRLVLNSALHDPKVAKLDIVKQQIEPVEWLETEIQGDFSVAPEILRISMKGDKPEQLVVLLDAIVQAYRREIVDNEKNQRRERLNLLRELREKSEGELRERRKTQREIEKKAGGRDAVARALMLSYERQNLAMKEGLLREAQWKLLQARAELKAQEGHGKAAEPDIPAAWVDEQLNDHPTIAKLRAQAQQYKDNMEKISEAIKNPEENPHYPDNRWRLKKVEAQLADECAKLRPGIVRRIQEKMRGQPIEAGGTLQARIAILERTEQMTDSEVERVRKVVENLSQGGSQLDAFQDDISHIEKLTQRLIGEEQALNVELEVPSEFKVLEEAQVLHADATKKKIMMVAGSAGGALAAVLLAVAFWEFRRRRVSSVEDVANDLGLRVVGVLPHSSPRPPSRLIGGSQDAYHAVVLAESVDAARTMLLHLARGESAQVVMVTSANAGEGKTSLSCHLAASMARMGLKTLLIDGDLRNPTSHRLFEVPNAAGLSELLLGEADLDLVIRPTAANGLSLLPAGVWDGEVSRALAQGQARVLFDRLRKEYDFIIVDSSPVLQVTDTLLIGQVVDAVIFSVLCEVSRLPSIYEAAQRMAALGIRNLGAIVNGVQAEPYVSSYAYAARTRGNVESEVSAQQS